MLWELGQAKEATRNLSREASEIRVRLADGERRMDFLSEENIRRQQEVFHIANQMRTLAGYVAQTMQQKPGRLARIWETVKSCGDIGDKVRWLILLILALSLNSAAAKDILMRALGLD
jgi:hypothetical protein